MIITCASCLTKFNLEDSRIPHRGAKVRCSRCRHVFRVFPPGETKEEAKEGDYHDELAAPGQKEAKLPLQIEEEAGTKEPVLSEKSPPVEPEKKEKEEKEKKEVIKGRAFSAKKAVQRERKGRSFFFILLVIAALLVFLAFYLLTELRSEGRLFPSLQYPAKKIAERIPQIFMESRGLAVL